VEYEYDIDADELCPNIAKGSGDGGIRRVRGLFNNIDETGQWPCFTAIAL
jgi:hypothetical protein